MSENIYDRDGLIVTTYVGPEKHNSPTSGSRTMVQITTWGGRHVSLTMDHWVDLLALARRLDETGLRIRPPGVPR